MCPVWVPLEIVSCTAGQEGGVSKVKFRLPRCVQINQMLDIGLLDIRAENVYNKHIVSQRSVVTRGVGQQVVYPCFFFIDKLGNILISDNRSDSILILTSEFELIHKISVSSPAGITIDKKDRIIVTSPNGNNCLQIF